MSWFDTSEAVRNAVIDAVYTPGSKFARIECPVCLDRTGKQDRRKSLSFNLERGSYQCFKCHVEGRVHGWAGDDGPARDDAEDENDTLQQDAPGVDPPAGYMPLWEGPATQTPIAAPALAYAEKRCPRSLWRQLQIGACLMAGEKLYGRVVIPVLDTQDRWRGWVARSWQKTSSFPYYNMPGPWAGEVLFNPAAVESTDPSCPMIVSEGVFDAIHLWPHAVGVLGKPTPAQVELILQARRSIAVVLDGDAWVEGLALAQVLRLEGIKAGSVRLPPRTDPDHFSAAQVHQWARECLEVEDEYKPGK